MFDEFIEKNKNNIINSVCELTKFKSVSTETENYDMPFGEECKKALDYTLNLGNSMGFKTKNLNNYCGYIEFGEGKELVGIIGHLDVVPANESDGWTTPPFTPDIRDNKIYARGTIDDKGPVISSLYAMKAVYNSGKKLNKRVRLILGINEEKNWKCIEYYKKINEETPTIGFSPDANFPCIYAEKGILSAYLDYKLEIPNMEILNIDCKNNAINVVPKYCSITLKYLSKENRIKFSNNEKIHVTHISDDTIKIIANGIASHAAHPELGDNAITNLIKYLNSYFYNTFLSKIEKLELLDIYSPKFFSKEKLSDESGILTSNLGFIDFKNNFVKIGFNLRVPVTIDLNTIKRKFSNLDELFPNIKVSFHEQKPLYIKKHSNLVQTLNKIFNEKNNSNYEPIAIGGGTYARAFENIVAFGCTFPGDKDMCHQVDEFIDINKLILSSKIYANAIYELAK